jgi:hypothetical protein
MKNIFRIGSGVLFITSIVAAVLAVGCGGGGGGGSSFGGAASGTLPITSGNAQQIATQAAFISGVMDNAGTNTGGVTAQNVNQNSSRINLALLIAAHVKFFGEKQTQLRQPSSLARPAALSPPQTINCTVSGSLLVTVLSSSSASVSFSDCVDSATSGTANGTMVVSALQFSDANFVPPWNVSANVSMISLSINDGVHVSVLDGTTHLADSMQSDGVTETFVLSGGPLAVVVDGQQNTLGNFSMGLTENQTTLAYTTSLDGTLVSDQFSGSVVIDTTVSFQGVNIDQNDPASGSMVIRGAAQSTATLTATGGGGVTIEVDANGDGVMDTGGTITTTWANLQASQL